MAYNPFGHTGWRNHVCGFYYNTPVYGRLEKTYLPQVELQAHATILATTSRTVLTQTFVNPSATKGIREVRYSFPLYDGVSVVGFTCHVGDRTIVGEVKEKDKARAVFSEAVARGETAGLFEQLPEASDVFTTTVGNIAPGAKLIVEIIYLGELKHDMEVDGTRFTIPNIICPRYGNYSRSLGTSTAQTAAGSGISITVDAEMADGSFIQKIQSPTHPIAMTMGTTSVDPYAEPTMTKASATLNLGTAELDKDFVLQIIAKNTGVPKAVLEVHPTIPNHRALMATLVPKFALPAEKPELVFVCDRSGSMSGSSITLVIQALKVFLKSLPVGVKFNICSFGSSYSFLWEKSVTYNQQSLDEAMRHVESFTANYGGTEMLAPLKATIEQRYKDMPLDVMLLTDGEIWNQHNLFEYLNNAIVESKAPVRTFTLGIGNGVSHALVEGIAKAGNGFSQTVGQGEKMDRKVVRMLKGALSPHINDYTLEVKYANDSATSEDDDDFEIVEKVADSLKIKLDLNETRLDDQKKPISLFDTSADPDKEEPTVTDETGEARYAHLPKILTPKIIQAPQNIPALFAFNRTTVYLSLGPEAPAATPKTVILRGTSAHGPLELEIPIQQLEKPGQTIHQLAAKKAIAELEQGRGWLPEAKNENGDLLKDKFEGRFPDMVEREAVRLGVQFQVGGKWCSFVAVESNKANKANKKEKEEEAEAWEFLEDEDTFVNLNNENYHPLPHHDDTFSMTSQQAAAMQRAAPQMHRYMAGKSSTGLSLNRGSMPGVQLESSGAFGSVGSAAQPPSYLPHYQAMVSSRGGDASPAEQVRTAAMSQAASSLSSSAPGLKRGAPSGPTEPSDPNQRQDYQMQLMLLEQQNKKRLMMAKQQQDQAMFGVKSGPPPPPPPGVAPGAAAPMSDSEVLRDYQMQLMYLRQDSKIRRKMGTLRDAFSDTLPQPLTPTNPASFGAAPPRPPPAPAPEQDLPDTQMSLNYGDFDYDLGLGDDGALENFDFDSFLHQPENEGNSEVYPNSAADLKNFGSAKSKMANQIGDEFLAYDKGVMEDGAHEGWGAAPALERSGEAFGYIPTSTGFSPTSPGSSPVSPGYSPVSPSRRPVSAQQFLVTPSAPEQLTHLLISLQSFDGSWDASDQVLEYLQIAVSVAKVEAAKNELDEKVVVTALVVALFEKQLKAFEGSWELVVEKAKGWLGEQVQDVEKLLEMAGRLMRGS